jgi:hypothetical protein
MTSDNICSAQYCRHQLWCQDPDDDFYCCALGLDGSADWCDDITKENPSQCPSFDGLPYTAENVDREVGE